MQKDLPLTELTTVTGRENNSPADSVDNGDGPLVLLVEDNESNTQTIASYLGAKGYRMLLAQNGYEAIQLNQEHRPNIILMDIQMPGMDGFEAIQHIRQGPHREVPILALTALAMAGDRTRCLAAGANDYLSKPVRLKELNLTIQEWLSHQKGSTERDLN
jgi:CheY-like chemotaxis protein